MTQEWFLANYTAVLYSAAMREVPADWIALAWNQTGFQEEVQSLLLRTLNKYGSLDDVGGLLQPLAIALTQTQRDKLYDLIKQHSQRPESEWRSNVLSLLNLSRAADVAAQQSELAYHLSEELFVALSERNCELVKNVVAQCRKAGIDPAQFTRLGYRADVVVDEDTPALSPGSELAHYWTPLEFAIASKNQELVLALTSDLSTVHPPESLTA